MRMKSTVNQERKVAWRTMEQTLYCQSCGMPMPENGELQGTNADGSNNAEFCEYCYREGEFTSRISMEEMIEECVPHMVANNGGMSEDEARQRMQSFFPHLKRWENA